MRLPLLDKIKPARSGILNGNIQFRQISLAFFVIEVILGLGISKVGTIIEIELLNTGLELSLNIA